MPKFLVRWRMNPKECFKTAEERNMFMQRVLVETRALLQSGLMKDWGGYVDGTGGYLILELPSEMEAFASLRPWMPQVDFDVRQVLTVDQLVEMRRTLPTEAQAPH